MREAPGRALEGRPPLDARALRADFPLLGREVNGHPLAYLDNAATSQKPRRVLEAMRAFYERHNANVHRGAHTLSAEATQAYEEARGKLARFLNAPAAESVVFTRNATEAINLVASAWGRARLRPGDEIVLTRAEHHSNLVPWHLIARERGAVIRAVGLTPEGRLDLEELARVLGNRTRLVSTGSTPTTWPPCWTCAGSRSGRGTTARSRSCGTWACTPPPAPASISTPWRRRSTGSWRPWVTLEAALGHD